MRLTALLVALLLPQLAAAGWATVQATAPPGPTPTGYTWRVGCVTPGQYELPSQSTTALNVRFEGLPDTGKCYFVVHSLLGSAVSAVSEEAIFDYDRVAQIPSTPRAAPTITWSVAPPVSLSLALRELVLGPDDFDEYELTVVGVGSVRLAVNGSTRIDWIKTGAAQGGTGGTVVSTTPTLGANNADGVSAAAVTFSGPVPPSRIDFDATPFAGGSVTLNSVTKALVRAGDTWSVTFP